MAPMPMELLAGWGHEEAKLSDVVRDFLVGAPIAADQRPQAEHKVHQDLDDVLEEPDHAERLRELRLAARDAMATLEEFRPRLAGPVLYGTAGAHAAIDLHVFATEVEAVSRFFLQRGIDFTLVDAPFRFRRDAPPERVSVFKVSFQGERLEIAVFPAETAGRTPLSPIDGRAMQRLTRRGLEELLESPDPISSFDAAGRDPVS